jgi:antitoxin component YwqK of YwqJK toxin-antitoxin module
LKKGLLTFFVSFCIVSAGAQKLADSLAYSKIYQLVENENVEALNYEYLTIYETDGKSTKPNGWYVHYNIDSSLNFLGHYKNGKREGLFIHFDENRLVERSEHFKKDKLEGPAKEYYSNSQVRTSTDYKKGKKHGDLFGYYMDGTKLYHGKYKKDRMIGQRMYWDHKGNPAEGDMKWYHENGVLKLTGKCVKGLPDGRFTHFDENGEMILTVDYKNGIPHGAYKVYDGEGNMIRKDCYYLGKYNQNHCR